MHIHPGDVIFVRQTGVDNFQEDWLPILSSLGITTLTLSREGGLTDPSAQDRERSLREVGTAPPTCWVWCGAIRLSARC
ncbi:MAG: hypothetical protein R3E96_09670 [Planctomycetota bacterium]